MYLHCQKSLKTKYYDRKSITSEDEEGFAELTFWKYYFNLTFFPTPNKMDFSTKFLIIEKAIVPSGGILTKQDPVIS